MEYIAFNQHKFASVIENINKELQVKGEGKVCYFQLFILLQYTSDKKIKCMAIPLVCHWNISGFLYFIEIPLAFH